MARGSKRSYTGKQKRQANKIEKGYRKRGVTKGEAERRAWATVNKRSGGGKKSGSGRKRKSGAKRKRCVKGSVECATQRFLQHDCHWRPSAQIRSGCRTASSPQLYFDARDSAASASSIS